MRDLKNRQVEKALKHFGFEQIRSNKHKTFAKDNLRVTLGNDRIIKSKTVECIIKQSGVKKEEFFKYV